MSLRGTLRPARVSERDGLTEASVSVTGAQFVEAFDSASRTAAREGPQGFVHLRFEVSATFGAHG